MKKHTRPIKNARLLSKAGNLPLTPIRMEGLPNSFRKLNRVTGSAFAAGHEATFQIVRATCVPNVSFRYPRFLT